MCVSVMYDCLGKVTEASSPPLVSDAASLRNLPAYIGNWHHQAIELGAA